MMTSGNPTFDLTLTMTKNSFVMICYAPSNAAYRMSLRVPGAELEGGFSRTLASGGGKSRDPAGHEFVFFLASTQLEARNTE